MHYNAAKHTIETDTGTIVAELTSEVSGGEGFAIADTWTTDPEELSNLQEEIESAGRELDELEDELSEKQTEILQLERELEEEREQRSDLEARIDALESELAELQEGGHKE